MTVPIRVDRTCIHCGKVVAKDRDWLCNQCGLPFARAVDPYMALVADNPPTLVRTYKGNQQSDTALTFRHDADELAKYGYVPSTQSWTQGQWGAGAFVVALLLCIVLIGILVFIYMLIVKPEGTFTVTYAKATGPTGVPTETPTPEAPTLSDRLAQLDAARSGGLITPDEYETKRAEVLRDL